MFTKVTTTDKIKSVLTEIFMNRQNKVTTLSDDSSIAASFFAIAKIAQKAQGDIALVESQRLPKFASGTALDSAAILYGATERLVASGSSTYVLIKADEGTNYYAATNTFSSQNGITFELTEDIEVGELGYIYVKVRSTTTGESSNVRANTIINVTSAPDGHSSVVNTVNATGGRDEESDTDFRNRITSHNNLVSSGTFSMLIEQARTFNSDILDMKNYGIDLDGQLNLAVILQNGAELTDSELDDLLSNLEDYFCITDLNKFGSTSGITLVNPTWFEVSLDFRVDIFSSYSISDIRQQILLKFNNYLDFRYWDYSKKVEWDDLLGLVKEVTGVRYVPDKYFTPSSDQTVLFNQLPRIKSCIIRDLDGNIILENDSLIPIFYSNS